MGKFVKALAELGDQIVREDASLRQRIIGTMITYIKPLPKSRAEQEQIRRAMTAAYNMGKRDGGRAT